MGIDVGFDMFPLLNNNDIDNNKWNSFLKEIMTHFREDSNLLISDKGITFSVGEHPFLPKEGYLFKRFSSKVSGSCGESEKYIKQVFEIIKKHFNNIHYWSEYDYEYKEPIYSWKEIYKNDTK